MDGGAWWATVHRVAKSRTRLSDFTLLFTFMHWRRKWQPTPLFLPWESQGRGSLMGCPLWDCTESDTTEATHPSSSFQVRRGSSDNGKHRVPQGPQCRGLWYRLSWDVRQKPHGSRVTWIRILERVCSRTSAGRNKKRKGDPQAQKKDLA